MQQIIIGADDRPVRKAKSPAKKVAKKRTPSRKTKTTTLRTKAPKWQAAISLKPILSFISQVFRKNTKKKKPKPSARKRLQNNWYRIAVVGGMMAAVTAPFGIAGYFIVKNSVIEKTAIWLDESKNQTVANLGLTIQEVSITGRERTASKSLMKVLEIKRGDSILEFDPEAARLRVEKLGWVETASVMRRFPDEIFVRITERRPFARWQVRGKTSVIDRSGVVVISQDKSEFQYLPKIVGAGANKQAADLFDLLSKTPVLFTRLHNAIRIRDRRWNLEFDNGVTVMLPEVNSADAWQELSLLQQEKKVLNKGVMAIDLRSKDRTYVRLRPDDAQIRRDHGKET